METRKATVRFENSETLMQNCGKRLNAAKRKINGKSTAVICSNVDVNSNLCKRGKVKKMAVIVDDLPVEV